jgi:hypothetical protein
VDEMDDCRFVIYLYLCSQNEVSNKQIMMIYDENKDTKRLKSGKKM